MKVLVFGATGFIGQKLVHQLFIKGHEINIVTRNSQKASELLSYPFGFYQWSNTNELPPLEAFEGVDAIINLAGESVIGRWTKEKKEKLKSSRIEFAQKIFERVQDLKQKPKHYISASAIGYYGDRKDEILEESSKRGKGFMPELCEAWEQAAHQFEKIGLKTSCLRIGIVLGIEHGALKQMLTPFSLGLGGPLGKGKQWMSWIHIDDLVNQFIFILEKRLEGIFNGTAPNPVRNKQFSKTLGKTLSRPALLPAPGFAIKLLFGEMSEIVLSSQRIVPDQFLKAGFSFRYTSLSEALYNLLRPYKNEFTYSLTTYQWFPMSKEELFRFFSDAYNLEAITPPWLNFEILKVSTDEIGDGTLLDYKIKLHGLPIKWKTKIIDWSPPQKFVDNQLNGPYKLWHHTHYFEEIQGGVLMTDRVLYQIPFSIIGNFANVFMVEKDVQKIFHFRKTEIAKLLKS